MSRYKFCLKGVVIITICFCYFILISCSTTHQIQSKPIGFTGHIYDKEQKVFNLKYKLNYDSLNSIKIRFYDVSGIKLIDASISPDTLIIKYILSDSYKEQIYNLYFQLNREICLYNLIADLFTGKMFNNSTPQMCYNKTIDENGLITISSLKYHEVIKLEGLKFKSYYGYRLASEMNLFINNKQYIFTIQK